ncbi:MarR family winged helix-turn-helix transcriptional regulator [Microbacterium sp. Leaf159]|uniref:MarR family winged helix-turn-helix transcriptional regulator n=1 Tax=Microbacterium sp. Leaf159 TaxID=1736279 RepID=UPI0007020601|nr:MarR family transcriptional regulator [Microbacterium sp. Leaf159]KQR39731.1 MarR family transcriptional regulator [Microbacterium sp. Leaf159]
MAEDAEFLTAQDAANDPRILLFGRLLGAANRLDFILGRSLQDDFGVSHSVFELLLLVGRAGEQGLPVRDIAQARVLTSGGATRLVQRAVADALVERRASSTDKRVQRIVLTARGEEVVTAASAAHAHNIEQYLIDVLPPGSAESFAEALRLVSRNAAQALPVMP